MRGPEGLVVADDSADTGITASSDHGPVDTPSVTLARPASSANEPTNRVMRSPRRGRLDDMALQRTPSNRTRESASSMAVPCIDKMNPTCRRPGCEPAEMLLKSRAAMAGAMEPSALQNAIGGGLAPPPPNPRASLTQFPPDWAGISFSATSCTVI